MDEEAVRILLVQLMECLDRSVGRNETFQLGWFLDGRDLEQVIDCRILVFCEGPHRFPLGVLSSDLGGYGSGIILRFC